MTPAHEVVEITQADREAAAVFVFSKGSDLDERNRERWAKLGEALPIVQAFARHRIASTPSGYEREIAEMRGRLRMIVSHATGGSSQDIDASVNDICVRISANRNLIYQAGKDRALEDAAKVAENIIGGRGEIPERLRIATAIRALLPSPPEPAALELAVMNQFPMLVIFDLDGTLADGKHREHYVTRPVGEKDWRAYFAACDGDKPVHPIVTTLRALVTAGHDVEIWTGRSDEVADKTAAWLAEHGLNAIPMRSRAAGDHTADDVLKAAWLAECSRKPSLVFEDRARVVSMWRSHGIVCCQVAPGDF